ncbi:MAG: MFS transporter, partial [Nocardiopsaceae bacterium]|nr:MFS transporter [Nocardiopsaceae bacterium]
DRIGPRPLIVAGLVLQGAGFSWVAVEASATAANAWIVVALFVAGIGIAAALPTVPAAVLSSVRPAEMGKASGVSNTMQRFGAVFAVAIGGSVFAAFGHLGAPADVTSGFKPAMAVAAALSLIGAMTALGIRGAGKEPAMTLR